MVKRVRPARTWQSKREPVRVLARRYKPAVRRDLAQAFKHLSDIVPVTRVAHLIRSGASAHAIVRAIPFGHYKEVLKRPFNRLAALHRDAAQLGVRKINGAFAQRRRQVRFRKSESLAAWLGRVDYERLAKEHHKEDAPTKGTPSLDLLFDMNKPFAKDQVAYAQDHGGSTEQCSLCVHWRGPDACAIVRGDIDPDGWCNHYSQRVSKDIGDVFNFDALSPEIQQYLRNQQDEMIAQLESDTLDAISLIVNDGVINGLAPEEIATDIRDMISLTDRQAQAVLNFRSALEDLDPQSLARQLRNVDYDQLIVDAIANQTDLADSVIDNMVDDYIDNTLDYRADMIADTEATRAANAGLHDAYSQAIDRGVLDDNAVRRYWQVALDEKTCEVCLSIPDQNEEGVGVDEDFDSFDGPMTDPPDPHPNCRCSVDYVTDLTQVPDVTEGEDTTGGMYGVGAW